MRFVLVALVLLVALAGTIVVHDRRPSRAPSHRVDAPPGPTASEESGEAVALLSPDVSRRQQRPGPTSVSPRKIRERHMPGPSASTVPPARVIRPRFQEGRLPADPVESGMANEGAAEPSSPAGSQDAEVTRTPVITPPVLQTPASIPYPADAFRIVLDRTARPAGLKVQTVEGRVVLRVLVRADGNVSQVEVAASSGNVILDEAASREAYTWRFNPAMRDDTPIESWALIPVRFVVP